MTASQNVKLPYLLLNLTLSTWTFLAFKKAKGDGFHILFGIFGQILPEFSQRE